MTTHHHEPNQTGHLVRNSEERYAAVFEHSNDAIFVIDPVLDLIIDVNPKASTMLSYSRDELLSMTISSIHPNEMDTLRSFAGSVMEHGQGWTNELTCVTKNGLILPAEISAALLEINGRPCIIALVRDITERKQAEAVQKELAVLEERTRLAREIHDSIAQGLTGIIWQLNVVARAIPEGGEHALNALERVNGLARDALQEVRRSVWDLRAGPLQGSSLAEVLGQEAEKLSQGGGMQALFTVMDQEAVLPAGTEAALLRICQESLANAAKHSHAAQISIALSYTESGVSLTIEDNGQGFDPDAPRRQDRDKGGFGLINMRERARILGGELTVHSAPGYGTCVEATLPVA